jgi:hypothetical protein
MRRAIASAIGRLEAVGNDGVNISPAGTAWTVFEKSFCSMEAIAAMTFTGILLRAVLRGARKSRTPLCSF